MPIDPSWDDAKKQRYIAYWATKGKAPARAEPAAPIIEPPSTVNFPNVRENLKELTAYPTQEQAQQAGNMVGPVASAEAGAIAGGALGAPLGPYGFAAGAALGGAAGSLAGLLGTGQEVTKVDVAASALPVLGAAAKGLGQAAKRTAGGILNRTRSTAQAEVAVTAAAERVVSKTIENDLARLLDDSINTVKAARPIDDFEKAFGKRPNALEDGIAQATDANGQISARELQEWHRANKDVVADLPKEQARAFREMMMASNKLVAQQAKTAGLGSAADIKIEEAIATKMPALADKINAAAALYGLMSGNVAAVWAAIQGKAFTARTLAAATRSKPAASAYKTLMDYASKPPGTLTTSQAQALQQALLQISNHTQSTLMDEGDLQGAAEIGNYLQSR